MNQGVPLPLETRRPGVNYSLDIRSRAEHSLSLVVDGRLGVWQLEVGRVPVLVLRQVRDVLMHVVHDQIRHLFARSTAQCNRLIIDIRFKSPARLAQVIIQRFSSILIHISFDSADEEPNL